MNPIYFIHYCLIDCDIPIDILVVWRLNPRYVLRIGHDPNRKYIQPFPDHYSDEFDEIDKIENILNMISSIYGRQNQFSEVSLEKQTAIRLIL